MVLEVREFDLITCNKHYQNQKPYHYLKEEHFNDLADFILTFNENQDSDAVDFLKIGVRKGIGKIIQAKNYVGVLQFKDGYQLQILPKILYNDDLTSTKQTFIKMLRCLKDFPGKVFNETNLKVDRMNVYEIFIYIYIQKVRELVKKGLRSTYIPTENNVPFYKGKLNVNEQIKRNAAHKERFFVGYDEFQLNRSENKLIKSTLLFLQKISRSSENVREIRKLLLSFEMVEPSSDYVNDFSRVVINRTTKDYEIILQWSKVFLLKQSFTTFSGDANNVNALLFPMEKVFESYVAKHLKKSLSDLPWHVSTQDRGYYLFDQPSRKFALRPDIVITRNDDSKIILDTKWKSLVGNPRVNYGISQSDMYQMYAYSKKYRTSEIWLLYPMTGEMMDANLHFESIKNGVLETQVRLFFVDITKIDESLDELKEKLMNGDFQF
jgi:5-methylcytosine-specific restriction enzyme subunit McrC